MKAKGRAAFKKHLRGEKISMRDAIEAKCYDCVGNYANGRFDCMGTTCSLYPYMPYKGRIDEKNSGQDSECLAGESSSLNSGNRAHQQVTTHTEVVA